MGAIEDLDRREFEKEQREARRSAMLGRPVAVADVDPAPVATPTATPQDAKRPAFTEVDELPKHSGRGRGAVVPDCRKELVAYAVEHPGKWLRYTPGDAESVKRVTSLIAMIRGHKTGFENPGLEGVVRNKELYVRYNPSLVESS